MIEQLLIKGLSLGAIYAMIAIGFCLLWQSSRLVNFAQGEFVTLPAFFMIFFYSILKLPFAPAILCAILLSAFVLGYVMKKTIVDTLIARGNTPFVVTTIALGFFIKVCVHSVAANATEWTVAKAGSHSRDWEGWGRKVSGV
jgi:branched-chain amino acid transport system permease protein